LVRRPVKAVILLFPIRGKLEELGLQEEAKIKEEGQVPVDPTVFWIKQTVRSARLVHLSPIIEKAYHAIRSVTPAARLVSSTP